MVALLFRPDTLKRKRNEKRKIRLTIFFLRKVKPVLIFLFMAGELKQNYIIFF